MQGLIRALGVAAALAGGAAHAQDYRLDPGFNGGQYGVDAFSGSGTENYRAKTIARLTNGDVVVAGVVPRRDGTGNALGIVRYDASGARQTWASPGAFGQYSNQYVIYDPAGPLPRPIDDVKDIVVFGDRLFVLVESQAYGFNGMVPPQVWFRGHAVDVVVFNVDGAYLGSEEIHRDDNVDTRDAFGGGIALYSNLMLPETVSLVYGGTLISNSMRRATFRRYTVANGALSAQTDIIYPNPGNSCTAQQQCDIAGIALGGRAGASGPPRIYLGGSHFDANWDFMAMRLDANGAPVTSFGGTGMREFGINLANTTGHEGGRAIVVEPGGFVGNNTDEIYVGGDVASSCADGVGIVKWRANGDPDTTFGPGGFGAVRYGDTYTAPGTLCFLGTPTRYAHALALADGKLALVGQTNRAAILIGGEMNVDAFFSVVDATTGLVDDYAEFPYPPTGQRQRHSGLWGVVGAGAGAFAAAGDVRFPASTGLGMAGKMQFATARFAPRPDLIFANGFQ